MTSHAPAPATTVTATGGLEVFRARVQDALFGALDEHVERLSWNQERLAEVQRDRLRELLAIAAERSPFHARRLAGIDPARFELEDLPRLPVMTKTEMVASFDEIVTDPRACRAAAEAAIAATGATPVPIDGEIVVLASGGTSGERGLFAFSAASFAEFGSTLMRPTVARLQALGGLPPGGLELAFVGADSAVHATRAASALLEGAPIRLRPVPVTLPLGEIVDRLNDLQPLALFGYPSMLARLATERIEGRLAITPLSVTATSETLRAEQRRLIRTAFDVPLVNTYGSTEGLAGVSPPDDPVISFASDACIVELVDAHDRPVPPGTTSDAILVTNLFNPVQPLIRYRIDDRMVQRPAAPEHGHLRGEVEGRTSDVLRFGDLAVHPLVIASPLEQAAGVADFQVRQTPAGVDIDVVPAGGAGAALGTAPLADRVAERLREAGLADPAVTVTAVAGIRRDPRTGKAPLFVPLR
jgi:phenylacetate-coenzyme A ligase PaaK-like adenylate-forming protein